jgi:hypothetical protein
MSPWLIKKKVPPNVVICYAWNGTPKPNFSSQPFGVEENVGLALLGLDGAGDFNVIYIYRM